MEYVVRHDSIDLDRAGALARLLDLDPASVRTGDLLRPMWHLVYFLPRPAQHALGSDGHPAEEFPSAPREGLRRMFAGGRLTLRPGLRVGERATARTTMTNSRDTRGDAGRLTFVTTQMMVTGERGPCLVDERDIVYIDAARSPAPIQPKVEPALPRHGQVTTYVVDPTLLFRFSALTYNAHRIHYDRDYARSVEGYPGLVVHGPLQALLMAEAASQSLTGSVGSKVEGDLEFEYRLVTPLFEDQGLEVRTHKRSTSSVSVDLADASGRVTARGELRLR